MAWKLIHASCGDVHSNMALDEALWEGMSPGDSPIICLHRFIEESVTLGFAQEAHELATAGLDHLPWTRRLTGGGAIHHHARTISFAVMGFGLASEGARPTAVAMTFGQFLVGVWKHLGLETRVVCCDEGADQSAPLCADRLYPGDVAHGARKVAGIGQRHRRGNLLVQAALMCDRAPLVPDDPVPALIAAVREHFGCELSACETTPPQRKRADELRQIRYLNDAWRLKRRSQSRGGHIHGADTGREDRDSREKDRMA